VDSRFRQGGHDAIQLLERGFRFVQVTLAQKHALKLEYAQTLVALLRNDCGRLVEQVDIVFLVPYYSASGSTLTWDASDATPFKTLLSDRGRVKASVPGIDVTTGNEWNESCVRVVGMARCGGEI